jgi:hypothetical protein
MIEFLYILLPDAPEPEQSEGWLRRFPTVVQHNTPEVACSVDRATGNLLAAVTAALQEADICSIAGAVTYAVVNGWDHREARGLPGLVVLCDAGSDLSRKVQKAKCGALWGACVGRLAIVYHHEPAAVWHEMFHLLGAEDCYKGECPDEHDPPRCGHMNCIMQCAPTVMRVGDPPFMCEANIQRIREQYRGIEREP